MAAYSTVRSDLDELFFHPLCSSVSCHHTAYLILHPAARTVMRCTTRMNDVSPSPCVWFLGVGKFLMFFLLRIMGCENGVGYIKGSWALMHCAWCIWVKIYLAAVIPFSFMLLLGWPASTLICHCSDRQATATYGCMSNGSWPWISLRLFLRAKRGATGTAAQSCGGNHERDGKNDMIHGTG